MKRTIEDLWNGNITSAEHCGVGDPEIENLVTLMEGYRELLNRELGRQQKAVFEKYVDCAEEYVRLISKCAFRDGFSLASKLMTEALFDSA